MEQSSSAPSAKRANAPKVSYRTVLKHPSVQMLSVSRAALKLAGATLSYGVMVYLARQGANQLEITVVSLMTYIAALLFGTQGGMLADSVAKRSLIVGGCFSLAAICFIIPFWFGTDVPQLIVLVFLSSAISQIISPGLKAVVALVATPEEMATTGALISLIGSSASALGSSFLSPILIKAGGLNLMLFCCSVIFLLGATRAVRLPSEHIEHPWKATGHVFRSWFSTLDPRMQARWIRAHPQASSIILLAAIAGALYEGFNTLMPVYVRDVLHADPANSVYIFALASIGFLGGTLFGPLLMALLGERRLIIVAVAISSVSMICFGLIDRLADTLAPYSPLRVVEVFGIDLSQTVLAASLLAIPANLGSSLASSSAQVYINRHVPVSQQGQLFGVQDVQRNVVYAIVVLMLGIIATVIPVTATLLLAPMLAAMFVVAILRFNLRVSSEDAAQEVTVRQAVRALLGHQSVR